MARVLGVDFGGRRIGLALSDATALLATPHSVVPAAASPDASARAIATLLAAASDLDPLGEVAAIVVGLPRRLSGEDTDQTPIVREFAKRLGAHTGLPVALQDERLSSREAESRLAIRDRDWRSRKAKLDAAAAAVILQDYLDARPAPAALPEAR